MKMIDAEGKILNEEIVKRLRSQSEGFSRFVETHAGLTVKG